MINKQRLIKLTQDLIRINSENPGGDESEIARFVCRYLKNFGRTGNILEFEKKRSNVISVIKGAPKQKSLLISPHLDTVCAGVGWKYPPFSGTVKDGRIYGLGATDCKCNLACALEALNSICEDKIPLEYELIFAATADEESGSKAGIEPLLGNSVIKPSAAVILDSDDFEVIVAQKGLIHLKVKLKGKRAHGAYPHLGVNAISQAVQILSKLKSVDLPYKKNKHLGAPTINIGTIRGGEKVNIVADSCEFELDIRFLPGMKSRSIINNLEKVIRSHTAKFDIEIEGIQDAYCIEEGHNLVVSLKQAMAEMKAPYRVAGSEGATVISFFKKAGIPAIATGFGTTGKAHTINEYAEIEKIYKGACVLKTFLEKYRF